MSIRSVGSAIALAIITSACGTTDNRPTPAGIVNYSACADLMEKMQRKNAGINRRTAATEAAYIATRNEKIAKANAEDLAREEQELAADLERHRQMCSVR